MQGIVTGLVALVVVTLLFKCTGADKKVDDVFTVDKGENDKDECLEFKPNGQCKVIVHKR